MKILAIDPGNEQSAALLWDTEKEEICDMKLAENFHIRSHLLEIELPDVCAIEMIASYGMPVGRTVFETCVWIGRFAECMHQRDFPVLLVVRKDVKMELCGTARAKDSNIRQALIDRYGVPGVKKSLGKLYGVKKDLWAALALAIYCQETTKEKNERPTKA